jgi:dihydroorotase
MYDLILKGGTVIDPSVGLHGVHDIAVQNGTIAHIAPTIAREEASRVFDVPGTLVTPGLIDLHAHVFEGFNSNGVHPDLGGVYAGVTTIVDAGSSGCATFQGFPRHIIPQCRTVSHRDHPLSAHLSDRSGDQPRYHSRSQHRLRGHLAGG